MHIFDQAEIHEHLSNAVTEIELYLKKHAFKSAKFGAMQREDVWSIPLVILREAIINALVHSDYSQCGSPIRIAFFDEPTSRLQKYRITTKGYELFEAE